MLDIYCMILIICIHLKSHYIYFVIVISAITKIKIPHKCKVIWKKKLKMIIMHLAETREGWAWSPIYGFHTGLNPNSA